LTQLEEDRAKEKKKRRLKRNQQQKSASIISPKFDKLDEACLEN
jgi:hypothetical protein